MTEYQKTVLYDSHVQSNGKIVAFSGWGMPLSFGSVLKEHNHVRSEVGVFDVSHMGEFNVRGTGAKAYLQHLTINNVNLLQPGQGQYTAMCHEKGGFVDDLFLYQLATDDYLLCVNAGNIEKDFNWCQRHSEGFSDLDLKNVSKDWSQLAVQGPASLLPLLEVFGPEGHQRLKALEYTEIVALPFEGIQCYVARTGYTGELGYEIYLSNAVARSFWNHLLSSDSCRVKPVGLGARDTLRLEACYLLFGQDIDESVSPLEAGISWATKLEKGDFIGRDWLLSQKAEGLKRKLRAFKMEDPGVPRSGMTVLSAEGACGRVTSGSVLPSVGGAGGLALISSSVDVGDVVEIDIRGKRKRARIVKRPLYQAKTRES